MTRPMSPPVQDIYPLSPTQRGLLFHSLYEDAGANTGTYIVQVIYTFEGALNRIAFKHAWQQLVARHTILRTAFVWDNLETPVQVVGQQVALPVHWQDWQHLCDRDQQQKFADLLTVDRDRGFNFSKAPLMRVSPIQTGPTRYRVLWTYHHILLDGWSLPILFKEWIALYQAACDRADGFTRDQNDPLGVAHPYRDYIAWLQKQDLAAAKQFWKSQLAGLSTPTPLGIKRTQNREQHFKEQYLTLSDELSQQLHAFAREHRLTLSNIVQGAWAKILSAYSGETTVMYGLARAGRPKSLPAANHRVGLFINTLPMRVAVDPQSELIPWLRQIQAQQLAQQPYEYTPLVEIQSVSDISRQSPLFESVIVFENYPLEPARDLAGLDLVDVSITEQTHYPLTLFAIATKTLSFKLIYNTQRFSQAAIARLFNHLHTVLAAAIATPHHQLSALNILPAAEQQQLIYYGGGPAARVPQLSVQAAIAQQASRTPSATAIISDSTTLSYSQLNNQANQLARYLQQQDISPGQIVGLCVERSAEMVVALLAILKAGCAYLPLDPNYPAARLHYATKDAGIEWIVCHDATAGKLAFNGPSDGPAPQQINLDRAKETIAARPISAPAIAADSGDLAYLIYTSGSTGQPKGVPISHKSLNNLLQAMAARLRVQPGETLMAVTTLAFDIAALELFLPLVSGATLLLASHATTHNSHQLIAYLDTFGVDIMQATPATWRLLLNSGWAGQSNLKILCGGEALDLPLAQRLLNCGEEVWNLYGPTETTIWSSALELSEDMLASGSVPIGQPLDNTQFYVLDANRQPVPVGVAGELYIAGVGLSQGYWNREALTAERFVKILGRPTLYRTGDLVRYREDGTLDYLGRLDDQIKLRGYRIELGEIETAIATYPAVDRAVVLKKGDSLETQHLASYITSVNQGGGDSVSLVQAVRSHLSGSLPHYMLPAVYRVIPSFPLTPNGKIDRQALGSTPTASAPNTVENNRPKTSTETTLAEIWRALLPMEAISIHDNFFEIGGHSLLVINARSQIRQKLGVELSMVDLFRYPTLSSLAAHIGQKLEPQEESKTESKAKPKGRAVAVAAGKQRLKQRLKQRKSDSPLGGGEK